MNGKGDKRRPMSITQSQYELRYEEAFKGNSLKKVHNKQGHSLKDEDRKNHADRP